jgi:hypothetical protein
MTGHSKHVHIERGLVPFWLCLAALLVVVLPLPPTSSSAEPGSRFVSFPGIDSELPAPNGPVVLANSDFDHRHPAHQLTLIDRAASRTVWAHDYGRHVLAGWSADGRFLAVTDYLGSDSSRVFIVRVTRHGATLVDVTRELGKSTVARKNIGRATQVRLEGIRWTGPDRLLLRLSGPDRGPFSRCYEYRVGAGFRLARATECAGAEPAH